MSSRDWMDHGTGIFLSAVDGLPDADLDEPTALPGWTRRHVVAHVHSNAEALCRLLSWARTGEENLMYASSEQRATEIEYGAGLPVFELRALVHASVVSLAAAMDSMRGPAWNNQVVTAQGRTVPASEIPWMRTREVAVHAVDLGTGVRFCDLPNDLNRALAAEALDKRAAGGEAAPLAEWLTGRAAEAPTLGPWL